MTGLPSLQQFALGVGLISLVIGLVWDRKKKKPIKLERLVAQYLGGTAVPPALFLFVCAFQPSLISLLPDLSLYLAAAGVTLLYVSVMGIFA